MWCEIWLAGGEHEGFLVGSKIQEEDNEKEQAAQEENEDDPQLQEDDDREYRGILDVAEEKDDDDVENVDVHRVGEDRVIDADLMPIFVSLFSPSVPKRDEVDFLLSFNSICLRDWSIQKIMIEQQ